MSENDEFFEKLYLDWYRALLRYVYRLTLDRQQTEEILQETFLEAYKKIELLRRHKNPSGWMYVTAKNRARNYLRKMRKPDTVLYLKNYELPSVNEDDLKYIIPDSFTKEEADIITRYYQDRQSIPEIAKAYGISLSACKMRLKRTRDKLKKDYEKNNFSM